MTGAGTLVVTLTDVNDNAPSFIEDYVGYVRVDTMTGDVILTVTATDPDGPGNGEPITFEMDCNTPECNDFTVHDVSGGKLYFIRMK